MRYFLPVLVLLFLVEPQWEMKRFCALPAVGCAPQVAGQDPTTPLILKSKETCEVGELVRLDATASDGSTGFAWDIIPSTPDFEVIEDGNRAFFSARAAGTYLVILAGVSEGKPYLLHHTITVIGQESPASIEYKIKQAYALVQTEKRQEQARAVAGVFRTLAVTEIEVPKILEATAKANRDALGDALQDWIPFLDAVGKELDARIADGRLGTREQYSATWAEIANSLEKAAK